MKIDEIRKVNLKRLIDERFGGSGPALAKKLGRSEGFLRQYNHSRNIGEKTARLIEKAASMPYGWMDVDHTSPDPLDAIIQELRDADPELLSAIRLLLTRQSDSKH